MLFTLLQKIENVYSRYWVVPSIIAGLSLLFLVMTLLIDHSLAKYYLVDEYYQFKIDRDGMRTILSVLATSSITITSVTFSLTVLTLSMASNQFGARLLLIFIRQGKTQFVIGVFLAVFIYSLLLLVLSSSEFFRDQPIFIALYGSVALAVLSFFTLIYFIKYVSNMLQLNKILNYLTDESEKTINRLCAMTTTKHYQPNLKPKNYKFSNVVLSAHHGFIKTIDADILLSLATKNDVCIEVYIKPGDHVMKKQQLAMIYSNDRIPEELSDKINRLTECDSYRSPTQDVAYGFEQILEIALKALSPGINNVYSAVDCLYQIEHLLHVLFSKTNVNNAFYDGDNNLRVIINYIDHIEIIDMVFGQLRHYSQDHIKVLTELLRIINGLKEQKLPAMIQEKLSHHKRLLD